MTSRTSQDLFSKGGLIVESLSVEFQKAGRDIAQLETMIDRLNLSGSCTDPGNPGCLYSWKVDCLVEMVGTVSSYGDIAKFARIVVSVAFGLAFILVVNEDRVVEFDIGEVLKTYLPLDSSTAITALAIGAVVVLAVYLRKIRKTRNVMQLREALLLLRLREKYASEKARKGRGFHLNEDS